MKKIYISGQITGLPIEEAKKNFMTAEKEIMENGHKPINPFRVSPFATHKNWKDYMKDDIEALINCDGIYLIKGWSNSKGARLENVIAESLGIDVYFNGGML